MSAPILMLPLLIGFRPLRQDPREPCRADASTGFLASVRMDPRDADIPPLLQHLEGLRDGRFSKLIMVPTAKDGVVEMTIVPDYDAYADWRDGTARLTVCPAFLEDYINFLARYDPQKELVGLNYVEGHMPSSGPRTNGMPWMFCLMIYVPRPPRLIQLTDEEFEAFFPPLRS